MNEELKQRSKSDGENSLLAKDEKEKMLKEIAELKDKMARQGEIKDGSEEIKSLKDMMAVKDQ